MTSLPPNDPLVTLWRTAPKPDTQRMLQSLHRLNGLHRRLTLIVLAILCGISLLLIFEEETGRVTTHGALSVIWILALIISRVWQRRARRNRSDALTFDTVKLLKFMIAGAKRDLFVARCLYAGVPCGAAIGAGVARIAGISAARISAPPFGIAVSPRLELIQTVAGLSALLIMMLAGVILARARYAQVQELSEKLRLIKAEL